MKREMKEKGVTLLITLLLTSILLAITASLLNITLKQFQISGIAKESEMAFHAADAGMDCALYYDISAVPNGDTFDVPGDESEQASEPLISCMGAPQNNQRADTDGDGRAVSGDEQRFEFDWGDPALCTKVSVYKFYDLDEDVNLKIDVPEIKEDRWCYMGYECTVIVSRGYNHACNNLSNPRTVEREITQIL